MSQAGRKVSSVVHQLSASMSGAPRSGDTVDGAKSQVHAKTLTMLDISEEVKKALLGEFETLREDKGAYLPLDDMQQALHFTGIKIPGYKCRALVDNLRLSHPDGNVTFDEFRELYAYLKQEYDSGPAYTKGLTKQDNLRTLLSDSHGGGSTLHSISTQEQKAFTNWVERHLQDDPECAQYFPFVFEGDDLYNKCTDGVLLCKLVNFAQPGTIVEKAINRPTSPDKPLGVYQKLENLRLALNSARALGCSIVNIRPDDLMRAKQHLLLGLVWQIIKIGLTRSISVTQRNDIVWMMSQVRRDSTEKLEVSMNGVSIANGGVESEAAIAAVKANGLQASASALKDLGDDLRKLSPEQIILNWVNYHLKRANSKRSMNDFGDDLRDSEIFAVLLSRIAPSGVQVNVTELLREPDLRRRAARVIESVARFDAAAFITPDSVVQGNSNLNLAFLANLFNTYPAIEPAKEQNDDYEQLIRAWQALLDSDPEETREERTYRNWMNSLGVKPPVQSLYTDLRDALVLFQLYELVKPGVVDFSKVHSRFHPRRRFLEEVENCNYAVQLGRSELKFVLVGIAGEDLHKGIMTLTLGLVWQVMRAYTFVMLGRLIQKSGIGSGTLEKDIIEWVNSKLQAAGKPSKLRSFQDVDLSDSRLILDLIEAIRPQSVKSEWVKSGSSKEDTMANAQLAITLGRKIGADIYALPEDITEVRPKMLLTIFACLMTADLETNQSDSM